MFAPIAKETNLRVVPVPTLVKLILVPALALTNVVAKAKDVALVTITKYIVLATRPAGAVLPAGITNVTGTPVTKPCGLVNVISSVVMFTASVLNTPLYPLKSSNISASAAVNVRNSLPAVIAATDPVTL